MARTLRRIIWDNGKPSLDPEDYEVVEDGKALGRIYRCQSTGPAPYWQWSVYGGPRGGRLHAGIADSLDEAKAAWLSAWIGPQLRIRAEPAGLSSTIRCSLAR
jgi:hypothetical protein